MADEIPSRAITVKIRKPEPPPDSPRQYIYHWDRIIGAMSALLLVIGLLGYGLYAWLRPSLRSGSAEMQELQAPKDILLAEDKRNPDSTDREPKPSASKPVPRAEIAAESSPATLSGITDAPVPSSASAPSSGPLEPAREGPAQSKDANAWETETPQPAAGTESPPTHIADESHLPSLEDNEAAISDQQPMSARDSLPQPVTRRIDAIKSGEDRQESKEQVSSSEVPGDSSASDVPLSAAPIGATQVSEHEVGARLTSRDSAEEPHGQGTLQLEETSVASPAVKRFLLARSVAGNEPSGNLDGVTVDAKGFTEIASFSEVVGLKGEILQYRWIHEGKEVLRIRIPVGAQRWRSHSTKRIYARMKGAWRAELRDSAGTLLASSSFIF